MDSKAIVPMEMLEKSISLKSIGFNELAWYGKDAIKAIEHLSNKGKLILGGDVYKIMGNQIETAYAGWHYDPITTKNARENIRAGEEKAVAYIRHFLERNGDNFIYAIVYQVFISNFCLETGY